MNEHWVPLEIPLRDIFAAVALHGIICSEAHLGSAVDAASREVDPEDIHGFAVELATLQSSMAYEYADAMMSMRMDCSGDPESN